MQQQKRIPEGIIFGEIPLEAAKTFDVQIWKGTGIYPPRIGYADVNTHPWEKNTLTLKFLPNGAKTAPHPQVVGFVKGPCHTEELSYNQSDPFDWSTRMEFHLDARIALKPLIDAVIRAEIALEALHA
jgi:hypothetical protein